jgi:hypothetical protein
MKKILLVLALTIFGTAQAGEITTCDGEYALCAASTCKPTGKTITGNNGTAYPEVECRCPILNGRAIADTSAGNMTGSCAATDDQHVWSLFAPKTHYPQEINNFSKKPKDTKVVVQACASSLNLGAQSSNCFSWNCVKGKNGIAVCSCPTGQVPADTAFLTEAGQGNPAACSQYPVSLPIKAQDATTTKGK